MTPPVSQRWDRTIRSHPAEIAGVRHALEAFALAHGFDEPSAGEIGLVLNEALANVIRHAYRGATDRPIEITARADPAGIEWVVRDWGSGVTPDVTRDKCPDDLLTPGGIGLPCMRKMTDLLRFDPQPDGMRLTMRRNKNRSPRHGT